VRGALATGALFFEAQFAWSRQALNAIFQMNKYLHNFTFLSVQHRLDLFIKLTAILNYALKGYIFNLKEY